MTLEQTDQRARNHATQTLLIPWYVNGTLGASQRSILERHLEECAVCRADLSLEREVHASMAVVPSIEYIPAASLKRLSARLDDAMDRPGRIGASAGVDGPGHADGLDDIGASGDIDVQTTHRGIWARRWSGAIAASVAIVVVALGLVVGDRGDSNDRMGSASYHTVTNARPTVRGEVIRAVFAPGITLVDLQSLLDEAQLRIVDGPTEAGVYSLASTTSRPVKASLQVLRQHPAVRFAESMQRDSSPTGAQ